MLLRSTYQVWLEFLDIARPPGSGHTQAAYMAPRCEPEVLVLLGHAVLGN